MEARDTARPLRRDVRLLGDLLGAVLVEQEGRELLDAVERIRLLARSAREQGAVADLHRAVSELGPDLEALVLRAFGLYFQLANIAEQHHRVRRRRAEARSGALRESLDAAFAELADVPDPEARRRAAATSVRLVLTAHPTEATRRTVLLAHVRIAAVLAQLDDPACTQTERRDLEDRLAEEITLLWQTDEVRHDRLRIIDEIRNGLWFFEHSLFTAAEELTRDWRRLFPGAPPPLSFGTWMGGDTDGNRLPVRTRSTTRSSVRVRSRSPGIAVMCASSRSSWHRIGHSCRSAASWRSRLRATS